MRKIAVIDSETDPFKFGRVPKPFIWGFYDGDTYMEFGETADLAAFLKEQEIIVYAHNGGKFDYHFLLPYMEGREKLMLINSRLAKWKLGRCELRDSYNILPVPLKQLNKDEFDYGKMEASARAEHMGEIRKYLRNDCQYLYDAITDFISRYGLHLTQATASLKQWEAMGNKAPTTTGAYYVSVKDWYYGGRVTPFASGIHEGDFDIVDINSAYPRAMLEEHPWGIKRTLTRHVKDSELARSLLTVDCYSAGAFPQRQDNGSLEFPHAFGRYLITGHEFIAAQETGTMRNAKIITGHVWDETINFKEFVTYFYDMKLKAEKEGDKAGRLFAKLLLNSFYGKFGADPSRYKEYIIDDYGEIEPEGFSPDAIYGEKQIFSRPLSETAQRYYNVAVAASITGWVRAYLWKAIQKVDTPLYCDTDSIICKSAGSLKMGDKIGEWALEGRAKSVAIAGKKLYACKLDDGTWKCASKGVRLSPQEIIRVAEGATVTYESEAPTFSFKKEPSFLRRRVASTLNR